MAFHKLCPHCGKPFTAVYRTARYCSISCSNSATTLTSPEDIREYLLRHVVIPPDENSCWEWNGTINDNGYGMAYVRQSSIRASRLSYEIFVGPIPEDLHVLHDPEICNNRRCINPKHLRCGTNYENVQDRFVSGTQPQGESHYISKITEDDVREIRRLYKEEHLRYVDIAIRFNIDFVTVHDAVKAKTWKHVDKDTYVPPEGDGRFVLTEDDVREMRRLRLQGMTLKALANRYGIHLGSVSNICSRKSWKHID